MPDPDQIELSPRRRALLDAAVHVMAREGSRGLTHRAVDREAQLPEGTCSAYFRSRDALLHAMSQFVVDAVSHDVRTLAAALAGREDDHDFAVEATLSLCLGWLDSPALLTTRLELTVAATRDDRLAHQMLEWRTQLVGIVVEILTQRRTGALATDAETLVAALDGVLLAALQRPLEQRLPFARASVEQLLAIIDPV